MLAPMYVGHDTYAAGDVATTLTRPATLKSSTHSLGLIDTDIVVEVWIDSTGRLVDYAIPPGQTWLMDAGLRRCIESALLCTQFEPATMFGVPTPGKLRISLSHNRLEVKG